MNEAASSAELHARASEIFLAVRGLDAEERETELLRRAGGDERLRDEVASLLAHDVRDPGLRRGDPGRTGGLAHLESSGRIGPYRILERIGRGSSGHVFLAEQETPIRRRVAIKIVPDAALDPALFARFEVERAALERTEHPGLARILDAGRTDAGLPYLVLDYVEGPTITAFCERRALSVEDRVRLVLDVADAVQHAHQRGVIHRDLKPGNILVAEVQGRPQPRVLDFGIAKPVAGTFPQDTPPTSGLPIGTPSYMAPEQTGLAPVDIRADVYALGAVLYELVAGRPPLEPGIERLGDPLEMLRIVRERVPEPASRARGRAGRGRAPRAFERDLDAILAKALEKPRERRYATVEAFAEDLRRLLRCEPVLARAPTLSYRTARFARRNRLLVSAGALALAALLLGSLGLLLGWLEARRERAEAIVQAEGQREINRFLTDDLLAASSPDRDGGSVTALELLHRASGIVDERFPDRPLVAASVHQSLGTAFAELGALDDADRHAARALEIRRASAGPDAPDTVRSEIAVASLLARRERLPEAEAQLTAAVARARRLLGPDDADLYAALNDLGVVLETEGRPAQAVPVLEEALAGRARLLPPSNREVLATINNLAQAVDQQGDTERSLALLLDALRRAEGSSEVARFTLLGLLNNIGATYQDLDRDAEAAPYLRRAASIASETLGPDHPGTLTIQGNLAALEAELGDADSAIELSAHVVERRTELLGRAAADTLSARHGYWNALQLAQRHAEAARGFEELLPDVDRSLGEDHWLSAVTRVSLARALVDAGEPERAAPHARRAAERLRALYGPDHRRTRTADALVEEIRNQLDGQTRR